MLAAPPPPASTQPGARPRATGTAEVRNATPARKTTGYNHGSAKVRGIIANQVNPTAAKNPEPARAAWRPTKIEVTLYLTVVTVLLAGLWQLAPWETAVVKAENSMQLEFSEQWKQQMQLQLGSLDSKDTESMSVTDANGNRLSISWGDGGPEVKGKRELKPDDFPLTFKWVSGNKNGQHSPPDGKFDGDKSSAASGDYVLNPALKKLLEEAETQYGDELLDWDGEMEEAAKEEEQEGTGPTRTPEERKREAEAEVKRILASRGTVRDILGEGTIQDQKREYRRIALLIHPDKNLVSGDKANFAYRLLNAVNKKLQER